MGNFLKALAYRIFQFPIITTEPICFYRQEDFTSSGVPIEREGSDHDSEDDGETARNYPQRKKALSTIALTETKKTSMKKTSQKYPGWDEHTILCLHNLFLLFDDTKRAMLSPEDFCAILECLGEISTYEYRLSKFQEADVNHDNWLSYEEFLPAIYYFNPPKNGVINGLAKLCFEASEDIKFVKNLTVGEQLEYGLF